VEKTMLTFVDKMGLSDVDRRGLITYVKANEKQLLKKMVAARRNAMKKDRLVNILQDFLAGDTHVGGATHPPNSNKISTSSYLLMVYHENGDAWDTLVEKFESKCPSVTTSKQGRLYLVAAFRFRLKNDDMEEKAVKLSMAEIKAWLKKNGDAALSKLQTEMKIASGSESETGDSD
jgi:hypothetical protein